jgi:hypothetical protein
MHPDQHRRPDVRGSSNNNSVKDAVRFWIIQMALPIWLASTVFRIFLWRNDLAHVMSWKFWFASLAGLAAGIIVAYFVGRILGKCRIPLPRW